MAVLALLTTPGPMADVPQLIPARWATGPLTRMSGASVWPDTCISGGSAPAGPGSQWRPAAPGTAPGGSRPYGVIATFSTVATPKPGSITISASWGAPAGSGQHSLHQFGRGRNDRQAIAPVPLGMKRFTASSPSGDASISTVEDLGCAAGLAGRGRAAGRREGGQARIMASTCPSTMSRM